MIGFRSVRSAYSKPSSIRSSSYFDGSSRGFGALRTCLLEGNAIDFQGIVEIVAETVRRNGWLIFTSHDVADDPSRFGVTPNLLGFALKPARDAGCDVVTVRDALRAVNGAVDAASFALASQSSL